MKSAAFWNAPVGSKCLSVEDMNQIIAMLKQICKGPYSTFGDEMTFWERLYNFKIDLEMRYRFYFWEKDVWSVFNDAHPGFPDLKELFKRKTGIVLLNVNEFTEAPRPTANIIRYIGGLAIRKPMPLNQDLNELLNKRSQNVLFSLGSFTQATDMPNWLKKDIISAFESFPNTTFIWKYEDEIDSNMLSPQSNIYTMKWVPQTDLLDDRRLSAFITHAGMNSVHEATYFGKPMIAIPLFGDQFRNADNLRRRGLAVMINRPDLNRNTLATALHEVLSENSTFALKAAMVARHLRGRPTLARAETSRWVRLVGEKGPLDYLILQSRNMSLIQYYNIDVIGYLSAQIAFALFALFKTARLIVGKVVKLRKYKAE
ncbi:unnamed protein product [Heligmosomoides polygyrus]|uniref:glucuronosyltransferase n=1 Tax=Heligmosomoides polygyrus TaxID=6339 RepID=A0A3P7Y9J3_HELPZ|nr:unnamed protein product [Heligmosomoides polygyrus]